MLLFSPTPDHARRDVLEWTTPDVASARFSKRKHTVVFGLMLAVIAWVVFEITRAMFVPTPPDWLGWVLLVVFWAGVGIWALFVVLCARYRCELRVDRVTQTAIISRRVIRTQRVELPLDECVITIRSLVWFRAPVWWTRALRAPSPYALLVVGDLSAAVLQPEEGQYEQFAEAAHELARSLGTDVRQDQPLRVLC